MKFIESYNKIVTAYMKDELKPYTSCACFVGNLLNNKIWDFGRQFGDNSLSDINVTCVYGNYSVDTSKRIIKEESNGFYTFEEVLALEQNFLRKYNDGWNEESLYRAMESTLLLLKKMHINKGEIIEDYNFTKRQPTHERIQ